MEQGRNPRDKPTHLWTPPLWQRRKKYNMEKIVYSINCAGKTRQIHVKEWNENISHHHTRNKLKMD